MEFVRLVSEGVVSVAELCRRFGISRQTGYVWLRRYQQEGEAGLVDRSRRPRSHPEQTPEAMVGLVCSVRRAHRAWGGRKIRGFLLRQGHTGVPAASTITQILRRNGLVSEPVRVQRDFVRFEAEAPNRLWQMDFKGWVTVRTGQRVHPFGVLDDHSRYNLCLQASANQQTPTVAGYLTGVFNRYGLPDRILMDNGSPWGHTRGYPWTPLTVWLADLGIGISHIRPFHPQTQGKEERFHRTLDLEVLTEHPIWDSATQLQDAFDDFRRLYNHHRPHEALGETIVPADRYQPSTRQFPTQLPPITYPPGTQVRKVSSDARFSFQGHTYRAGKPFRGKPIGLRSTTTPGTWNVYYRNHHIKTITTIV
ncbi:MAG: IS481 family transposase [Acidimicrobiia bacterium]|nr:IS481 family transposase [Acidimicrobiia bacterium]